MKNLRRFLLVATGLLALSLPVLAQDASDLFLRAYQEFQAGEKSERDANVRDAFTRYQSAAKLLEQIVRDDPAWQPPVVEYRLRKTRENIERLSGEVAKLPPVEDTIEGPLPVSDNTSIALPPPAVNTSRPLGPSRSVAEPRSTPQQRPYTPPSTVPGGSGEVATLRRQLAEQRRENERLQERLTQQTAELQSARFEIDRTKVSVVELKAQLAQARDAYENALRDRPAVGTPAVPDERLDELGKAVVALEAENQALVDDNSRLLAKLENAAKYIEASDSARKTLEEDRKKVAKQRDEAAARTKKIRDNTAQIEKLTAEKEALTRKLANSSDATKLEKLTAQNKELAAKIEETEKKLEEALAKPAGNEEAMATLRSEINTLNDRLLEAQTQITSRDDQIRALASQLDESSGDLARLKLNPSPGPEDKKLIAENELLRGIILRQIKEQTERDTARAALEKELTTLQVKSETLSSQLGVLAKPAFQLTEPEQELFREPSALINEPAAENLDVSLAVAKAGEPAPTPPPPQGADALPETARESIEEARKLFNSGNFSDAEKVYQQIVEDAPDNYFALSNLGVTQIQARKLSAAEVALKKAVAINPRDSFAATNLGIVYCKQGRFDEAITALQEAITVDDKDHIAHNYLGVCLGEKGLKGEAEQHFKRSIEARPDYADAHFNLAVLYATTEPPSIELAREHYDKAVAAGASPDASLERLIK